MTDVFRTYYWVMLVNTICSFSLLTELQICSEWQGAHPQMKNHDLFQPVWKIHISKFPTSITTEEGHVICFWGKNGLMKNCYVEFRRSLLTWWKWVIWQLLPLPFSFLGCICKVWSHSNNTVSMKWPAWHREIQPCHFWATESRLKLLPMSVHLFI